MMITSKTFFAAFFAVMAYFSLATALPLEASANASLAVSDNIPATAYPLTCANYNLQTSYIKGCHDFFLAASGNSYFAGQGGVHLCAKTDHMYITGTGNDVGASGLQIADAVLQLMEACGARGGSVSANYQAANGKDFVVHVADKWV